eukprot:gene5222-5753_t
MGQVLVGIAPQLMIKKVEVVLFLSVVLLASFFAFGMRRAHQGIRHGSTLLPRLNQLNSQFHVILASGSPRRKELLNLMGIQNFNICVSDFAEDLDKTSFPSPAAYCQETSRRKVENVIAEKLQNVSKNTIVIGADTIVVIDGMVLEKPVDDLDAKKMLLMLSGNTHEVHTSVTLYSNALPSSPGHDQPQKLQLFASFVETSKVTFSPLTEADLTAYIASGEGRDKAGSYGIQGLGGQMVESIEGCYFNIMGLPINSLSKHLSELLAAVESNEQENNEL